MTGTGSSNPSRKHAGLSRAAFLRLMGGGLALAAGGADLFLLETFTSLDEAGFCQLGFGIGSPAGALLRRLLLAWLLLAFQVKAQAS